MDDLGFWALSFLLIAAALSFVVYWINRFFHSLEETERNRRRVSQSVDLVGLYLAQPDFTFSELLKHNHGRGNPGSGSFFALTRIVRWPD